MPLPNNRYLHFRKVLAGRREINLWEFPLGRATHIDWPERQHNSHCIFGEIFHSQTIAVYISQEIPQLREGERDWNIFHKKVSYWKRLSLSQVTGGQENMINSLFIWKDINNSTVAHYPSVQLFHNCRGYVVDYPSQLCPNHPFCRSQRNIPHVSYITSDLDPM